MAPRRSQRANTSRLGTANTLMAPVESPTLENLSENQQTPSYITVGPQDQPAPEGPSEDRQPAEDPGKDLPAVASPSEDQPTTDGPLEDPKPAEDLTIASPAGEALSNTPPAKEPSTTLPHLNSPSDGQQTTEVQAGDRQTAEGPTTDQQVEKAPEDTPVSESLPNGQSTKEGPAKNGPAIEDLPITPTIRALPSSGELSDVPMADSDQEPREDLPSYSDTIEHTSRPTNPKTVRFQPSETNGTVIDLTTSDSEDEAEQSTSDGRHRPSPSPEFEISSGGFDIKQDSEYIRAQVLGLPTGDRPASALLDAIDASYSFMKAFATKASSNKSTILRRSHQPKPHRLLNEGTRTSSHDSDDNMVKVTRSSHSSKRSLNAANGEVGDQATSHKCRKVDKDTTLPDSRASLPQDVRASGNKPNAPPKRNIRPKFGERSLKDSMDTELEWLNSAKKSSEKFCRLSLDRTAQLSNFIELEAETTELLDSISAEDRPQLIHEYIRRLRKVEARRRGISNELFRNVTAEYGECTRLKHTVEQWIVEEARISRRIERC